MQKPRSILSKIKQPQSQSSAKIGLKIFAKKQKVQKTWHKYPSRNLQLNSRQVKIYKTKQFQKGYPQYLTELLQKLKLRCLRLQQ